MDPVSKVEKDFIINAAKDKIRVDGRSLNELRDVSIDLKRTYTQSSAVVSYGETKCVLERQLIR
jgi:singapore isolate B (sub-type 7) whole genome shotgun sequence assembly, scaffold_14